MSLQSVVPARAKSVVVSRVFMSALVFCMLALGAHPVAFAQTAPSAAITAVNLSGDALRSVPMTFGQPFRSGDIPAGDTVAAFLGGQALPTQVDAKATNPDGSLRHAVVTVQLPMLGANASEKLALRAVHAATTSGYAVTLDDLLDSGFDADVTLQIDGKPWHLDARALLQHAELTRSCQPWGAECSTWLSGPLVSEWIVGGPILDTQDNPHPHLAVYFAIRAYGPAPVSRVRVDVIVENDWAYAPDPHNITYDASIDVGGQTVYSIDDLTHYQQARWHKTFWWGAADPVYAQQDSQYLQATLAVPQYQDAPASAAWLATRTQSCAPMQPCDQTPRMANTGAQDAIGPLPRWTAAYVINPIYPAFRWMLADSDALGAYATHYRDQATGRTLALADHPCATTNRNAEVARCPVPPHADDRLPECESECSSPLAADEAHHPSPAYVAYLVTGDWYYLTELTDWAVWVPLSQNQAYRDYANGRVSGFQERGQGWALRTLGYAAYILPDTDPFKSRFNHMVEYNIDWFNENYTDDPDANALHIIRNGYTIVYTNNGVPNTGIATWQNSFFVWSVGNLRDLGFAGAGHLLDWVARFPVDLMTSPEYCWVLASTYELQVRDAKESPIYGSLQQAYAKSFPQFSGVACNSPAMWQLLNEEKDATYYAKDVMSGYPQSPTGFPANFQVGLAVAAESGAPNAANAWTIFSQRALQPDYSETPQFAIVPRISPAAAPASPPPVPDSGSGFGLVSSPHAAPHADEPAQHPLPPNEPQSDIGARSAVAPVYQSVSAYARAWFLRATGWFDRVFYRAPSRLPAAGMAHYRAARSVSSQQLGARTAHKRAAAARSGSARPANPSDPRIMVHVSRSRPRTVQR